MKPPARKSCQSTRRMLATRAVMMRPEHVEAHLVADADARAERKLPSLSRSEAFLDRHLGLARRAGASPHHCAVDHLLVRLELRRGR